MVEVVKALNHHLNDMVACEPGAKLPDASAPLPEPCFTILAEGKPIAVLGFFPMLPGMMLVWGYVSKDAGKYALSLHRKTLQLIESVAQFHKIRRMEATVRCGYRKGWRWATALGFQSEGMMAKYGPDNSDHWRFARIF